MASTFFGLTVAYTGLQSANTSINTTAHNISNLQTTGYTKQTANSEAGDALRTYATYGCVGTGVVVTSIDQIRDSYYDVKYRNNATRLGEYNAMQNYMTQIEDYLNETNLQGFTAGYDDFFAAVSDLIKNPADESTRNTLINAGKSMAEYFNNLTTNLTNIQKDANEEIKNSVSQINTIAQNISALNKQINQIEACNGTANDLRDKRNNLLDQLSQIINIDTTETPIGNGLTSMEVRINGQVLVSNYNYNTLSVEARGDKRNASDAEGLYNIKWTSGLSFDMYSSQLEGSMKALIDVRDGCNNCFEKVVNGENGDKELDIITDSQYNTSYKGIPYYQSKINEFVKMFTDEINNVFTSGQTIDGELGIPFFEVKYSDSAMSAGSVQVNNELVLDQSKLATQTEAKGESYCDLLETLYGLKDAKVYNGGSGQYFLQSIVGTVAIDSEKANKFQANFKNISNTIQNQRLSVMGVDSDEEGMDLMKFQQAYNLSSKMMSVMNEIYNKLINETGV